MNDVTINLTDGTTLVLDQEMILRPKFICPMDDKEYISSILRNGIIYVSDADVGEGLREITKLSPYCLCSIKFIRDCPDEPCVNC